MIWRLVFVNKKLENEGFIEEGNFGCWSNSENHRVFHLSTFNKALQNGFEERNCPRRSQNLIFALTFCSHKKNLTWFVDAVSY